MSAVDARHLSMLAVARRALASLLAASFLASGLVVASAPPAAAGISAFSTSMSGGSGRVSLQLTAPAPAGDVIVRFGSTTATGRVWEFVMNPVVVSTALAGSTVAGFDPRNVIGTSAGGNTTTGTPTFTSISKAPTGWTFTDTGGNTQAFLPNDVYSTQLIYTDDTGVLRQSSTSTLSTNLFTSPPTISAPAAGSSFGTSSAVVTAKFPQSVLSNSAAFIYTGTPSATDPACATSLLTVNLVNPSANVNVTVTYSWPAGTVSSTVSFTSTGSLIRGCSYDVDVRFQSSLRLPAQPDTVAVPQPYSPSFASARVAGVRVPAVPAAPTDVIATPGDGSVDLSWTAPGDDGGATVTGYVATAYEIGGDGSVVGTCTTTETRCTIQGLSGGVQYEAKVLATNAVGDGTLSAATTFTAETAPGAPTITATPGDRSVDVSWTHGTDNGAPITSYTAQAFDVLGDPAQTVTCTTTTTSCTITGLTAGRTYLVSVTATNSRGTSPSSDLVSVDVYGPPAPPVSAEVLTEGSSLYVSGVIPGAENGAAVSYYTAFVYAPHETTPTESCTFAVADSCGVTLPYGVPYTVTVVATNSYGDSEPSTIGTYTLTDAPGTPQITGLTPLADPYTGKVKVTVALGAENGSPITSYTVVMRAWDDVFGWGYFAGSCSVNVAEGGDCVISNIYAGNRYKFQVTATNAVGSSSGPFYPVWPATAWTPVRTPYAPGDVVVGRSSTMHPATSDGGQLVVGWNASSFDGNSPVLSYTATATAAGQATRSCTETLAAMAPGDPLECAITDLTGGVEYTVTVVATNSLGSSAPALATGVPAAVPSAPTGVTVAHADLAGELDASWTAPEPNGSPITSYEVLAVADEIFGMDLRSASCTATGTSCRLTGLVPGVGYYVSVRAVNEVGPGPYATTSESTLTRLAQSVTVSAPAGTTYVARDVLQGGDDVTVTASSDASLPVTVTSTTPEVCSVVSHVGGDVVVRPLAMGTCELSATQAGTENVAPATATTSFAVLPRPQTLLIPELTASTLAGGRAGESRTVTVTTNAAGLEVSSATPQVCTVTAGDLAGGQAALLVDYLAAGSCRIEVSTPASPEMAASEVLEITAEVAAAPVPQTLSFPSLPTLRVGGTAEVTVSASSGLTPAVVSTTPQVCTGTAVTTGDGARISIAALTAGECVLRATQDGDETYAAATPVERTTTVTAAPLAPAPTVGPAPSAPGAPAPSSGALSWPAVPGAAAYTVRITVPGHAPTVRRVTTPSLALGAKGQYVVEVTAVDEDDEAVSATATVGVTVTTSIVTGPASVRCSPTVRFSPGGSKVIGMPSVKPLATAISAARTRGKVSVVVVGSVNSKKITAKGRRIATDRAKVVAKMLGLRADEYTIVVTASNKRAAARKAYAVVTLPSRTTTTWATTVNPLG